MNAKMLCMLLAIGPALPGQQARGEEVADQFEQITLRQIQDTLKPIEKPPREIDGSNNDQNKIPAGTIIVYQTNAGNLGKAIILAYGYNLTMRWATYRPDGTLLIESSSCSSSKLSSSSSNR